MRIAILAILTWTFHSFADTNSDLYMACPKQREALNQFTGGGSSQCQSMLAKAAKCCNLFPGCEVSGVGAGATNGNIEGGQLLISALQARVAGIDANIHKCDEASSSADLPCMAEKAGATAADKQLKIKFNNAAGNLRTCLAGQKPGLYKQILQAGGSVKASGGTPNYGENVTEQQILQQLQAK